MREYEGSKPYIFVSYCRQDSSLCKALLQRLTEENIRYWYDHEIDPGEKWPEIIGTHLAGCTACVALITTSFTESYNCNKELAFCTENKIPVIPVLVDQASMSLGMQLSIAGSQRICVSSADHNNFEELLAAPVLEACRGEDLQPEAAEQQQAEPQQVEPQQTELQQVKPQQAEPQQVKPQQAEPQQVKPQQAEPQQAELQSTQLHPVKPRKKERTEVPHTLVCIWPESGRYAVEKKISAALPIYTSGDPARKIAEICWKGETPWLRSPAVPLLLEDGSILLPGQEREIQKTAVLTWENGELLICLDQTAEKTVERGIVGRLSCSGTRERKYFLEGPLYMGRDHRWAKGTMDDDLLNGCHCVMTCEEGYAVEDLRSCNGVLVNGRMLPVNTKTPIHSGDLIQMGRTVLLFEEIRLERTV